MFGSLQSSALPTTGLTFLFPVPRFALPAPVLPAFVLPAFVLPALVLPVFVLPAFVLPELVLCGVLFVSSREFMMLVLS